jgi:biotin transport system substrate-specific component
MSLERIAVSLQAVAPAPLTNRVLADLVPGALARNIALVVGGAAFIAVFAQLALPLPFTPVPLSLGSFAVLLTGAALGPVRAGLSLGLYAAAGIAGAPIFAGHGHGYAFASFGYVLAYILAAVFVGHLARRGHDRSPLRLFGGIAVASLIVYSLGVPWLMAWTGADLRTALVEGVLPFLPGDAIKAIAVSGLLPIAWRVINRQH